MGCLNSKPKEDKPATKPDTGSSTAASSSSSGSSAAKREDGAASSSSSSSSSAAKKDPLGLDEDDEPVRNEPIEDFYDLGREIGRGGFSVVVEAVERASGKKYAIKCIKKTMVEGDDIKLLRREIKIMKKVDHPNILKLFEVFEDEDEFYLVMELFVSLLSLSLSPPSLLVVAAVVSHFCPAFDVFSPLSFLFPPPATQRRWQGAV